MRFSIFNQILLAGSVMWVSAALAAPEPYAPNRIPDVSNTRHNFSATATPDLPTGNDRNVAATTQTEVCVFCHTPHYAGVDGTTDTLLPLWNHETTAEGAYTLYSSGTLDGTPGQPGTASKMCLSCHDGTVAVGSVLNPGTRPNAVIIAGGQPGTSVTSITPQTIAMTGSGLELTGEMVAGTDGYTPNLGTDLSNDHPIGFTYNTALATTDGDLADPAVTDEIGTRVGRRTAGAGATSTRFSAPLESGNMECTTCHDPHLRGTGADEDRNIKFLRMNRFQQAQGVDGTFSLASDIGCMACHKKDGWADSSHAHASVTDLYNATAAAKRDFPADLQVWEAGCMNCHDSHTITNANHLLRDGSDGTTPMQEETCFQCHGTGAKSALQTALPDLETLMTTGASAHDVTATELHTIQPAATLIDGVTAVDEDGDHVETQALVDNASRHVECGDCHHPHRSRPTKVFDSTHADVTAVVAQPAPNWAGVDFTGQGTHVHEANTLHTNIASGALRGTWGVDFTQAASVAWGGDVASWTVLQDDPGETPAPTDIVTKEYQVCMKCHSSFANLATATSQSMEFQAPDNDMGEATATNTPNHRSWHPVTRETGRTSAERASLDANTFEAPFDVGVGQQTMYCSDCHGSDSPLDGEGPHGSSHNKVVKAEYNDGTLGTATGQPGTSNHLCFSCHKWDQYGNSATLPGSLLGSGFSCAVAADCWQNDGTTGTNAGASNSLYTTNLHIAHAAKDANYACTNCHMMQPHGSENKALLVDASAIDTNYESNHATYGAKLQVDLWKQSGNWSRTLSGAGANDNCATSGCHTYP